jgi:hypothetical protein
VFGEKRTERAIGMFKNMMFIVVFCTFLRWVARYINATGEIRPCSREVYGIALGGPVIARSYSDGGECAYCTGKREERKMGD